MWLLSLKADNLMMYNFSYQKNPRNRLLWKLYTKESNELSFLSKLQNFSSKLFLKNYWHIICYAHYLMKIGELHLEIWFPANVIKNKLPLNLAPPPSTLRPCIGDKNLTKLAEIVLSNLLVTEIFFLKNYPFMILYAQKLLK